MMTGHLPRPAPLGRISPTTANALLACPLKVAYQRDPSLRPLAVRPRPDALLGAATHHLAEATSRGDFDKVPPDEASEELGSWWDRYVARGRSQFEKMGSPGSIPVPMRWPFYALKRVRAVQYAQQIVDARRCSRLPAHIGGSVELELQSDDPPLSGRIDRVERGPQGVCLVDLKTGASPSPPQGLPP